MVVNWFGKNYLWDVKFVKDIHVHTGKNINKLGLIRKDNIYRKSCYLFVIMIMRSLA